MIISIENWQESMFFILMATVAIDQLDFQQLHRVLNQ
jgi:hypothetical protein